MAVDVFDQMTKMYSVEDSRRRWPMYRFYNMINSALINGHILYKHVCKEGISRRQFIQRVWKGLTGSMPCNASEDKDMSDKPPCKVHCVAERSKSTSKPPHLNS